MMGYLLLRLFAKKKIKIINRKNSLRMIREPKFKAISINFSWHFTARSGKHLASRFDRAALKRNPSR